MAGAFDTYNGTLAKGLVRLLSNGTIDPTFNPPLIGFSKSGTRINSFWGLTALSSGEAMVLGDFDAYNSIPVKNVAKIQANGARASNFSIGSGFSQSVGSLLIITIKEQKDGNLLFAGYFDKYNGNTVSQVTRVLPSGTFDSGFDMSRNNGTSGGTVNDIYVQKNGQILVAGNFTQGGKTYNLLRLNADGGQDTNFVAPKMPPTGVNLLSVVNDSVGKVIVGGGITTMDDFYRGGVARLTSQDSCKAPNIIAPQVPVSTCAGKSVQLTVQHNGFGPFSYSWKKGNLVVGTFINLNFPSVTINDDGLYTVTITGKCGVIISRAVKLTVNSVTSITRQPSDTLICDGSPQNLKINAIGGGLHYKWIKSGTVTSDTGSNINFNNIALSDTATWKVIVSGLCGTDTSLPFKIKVNSNLSVLQSPKSDTVCNGQKLALKVIAQGPSPVVYQWYKGGTAINLANSDSLVFSTAALLDSGSYQVKVTSPCGSVFTNAAKITINPITAIITPPVPVGVCAGKSFNLSVSASGAGLHYEWIKGNSLLRAGNSLNVPVSSTTHAGKYAVRVTGACPSVLSDSVLVTIKTTDSASFTQTIPQGTTYNFGGTILDSSGTYSHTFTNHSGCDSVVTLHLTVLLGNSQKLSVQTIKIYPNPANCFVGISNLPGSNSIVNIYGLDGKQVFTKFISGNEAIISISELVSGMYIVEVTNGNRVWREKLVVNK